MEAEELREIAQRVREWQLAKNLSDAELCRKFGELGSTKTYKRILDNQLEELDLERQLNNYRTAWALIEGGATDEREEEEIERDLYATVVLNRVFLETRREKGLARCIFLIGPSGSGKTCAQDYLRDLHGPRIIGIQAVAPWNDSPMAMMAEILARLGVNNPSSIQSERWNRLVEKLGETRRALFIEDAHHLGPRCLATIISLIDRTPGEFLLAAVDSLWAKIQTRAYQEIEQLRVNRLAEKITLGREVREKDVQKLLDRRIQWATGADGKTEQVVRQALKLILSKANSYGRLAFVRQVIKRAKDKAGKDPVSIELFAAAIEEEVAKR
jgi:hypothetical protein